jgi:hypothetical protein
MCPTSKFGDMRVLILSVVVLLAACSERPHIGGVGDPPSWVSTDRLRPMVEQYIAKRGYKNARLVEERGQGQFFRYRFAIGDVLVAESVVVDRKSGRITLEHVTY